jgi:hypothetical protein
LRCQAEEKPAHKDSIVVETEKILVQAENGSGKPVATRLIGETQRRPKRPVSKESKIGAFSQPQPTFPLFIHRLHILKRPKNTGLILWLVK